MLEQRSAPDDEPRDWLRDVQCPACGQANWSSQAFCTACGTFLKAEVAPVARWSKTRKVTVTLAAVLVLVGVVGSAVMGYRFHRAKQSWRPLSSVPERPTIFPDMPRPADAGRARWPVIGWVDGRNRAEVRRTVTEQYPVPRDIERVAAWYRDHLDPAWRETSSGTARSRRVRFERRTPDGTVTALLLSPGYRDLGADVPVVNGTWVLILRWRPSR